MTPCPTCGRSREMDDAQITETVGRLETVVREFGRLLGLSDDEICRLVNVAEGGTRDE